MPDNYKAYYSSVIRRLERDFSDYSKHVSDSLLRIESKDCVLSLAALRDFDYYFHVSNYLNNLLADIEGYDC